MDTTKRLATYIEENGIALSFVCDKSGLSKNIVYPSLGNTGTRKLRVDEYFLICNALGVNPLRFVSTDRTQSPDKAS